MSTATMSRRPDILQWPPGLYDKQSMLRSEEQERKRQEARALREQRGGRGGSSAPPEQSKEIFTMVRNKNPIDQEQNIFQNILGDFSKVAKHHTEHLIGVDHQPQTPAPSASHIHDPDNYTLPTYTPKGHSEQRNFSHRPPPSHTQNSHGSGMHPPRSQPAVPPPHKAPHLSEEVKPSLESGPLPGPGPGTGQGSRHHERGGLPPLNTGRGRPRSHDRSMKDPQVLKIMSEMDLKSPLSANLQTPRPDHHSSFTFPVPSNPVGTGDSSAQGFRHPQELHSKSVKPSEHHHSSAVAPSKALDSSHADVFKLSEESDDENDRASSSRISGGSKRSPSLSQQNGGPNLGSGPPLSPFKISDDSSNSEDSSGTESESSSSETQPVHATSWSLETLFQQNNNKNDDADETNNNSREDAKHAEEPGSKAYWEKTHKDIKPEPLPTSSPHMVNEPAPPVITTVPSSKGGSKPLLCPTSEEESSDEDCRRPPSKAPKLSATSRGPYNRSKATASLKSKTIEPNLSSDSDDEHPGVPVRHRKPTSRAPGAPRSPKKGTSVPLQTAHPSKHSDSKRTPRKRETAPALAPTFSSPATRVSEVYPDSDSDSFVDVLTTSPEKKKVSSAHSKKLAPPPSPKRSSRKQEKFSAEDQRRRSGSGSGDSSRRPQGEKGDKKKMMEVEKKRRKSGKGEVDGRKEKGWVDARREEEPPHTRLSPAPTATSVHRKAQPPQQQPYPPPPKASASSKAVRPNDYVLDNGVPKIMCKIPINLINKLPGKAIKNSNSANSVLKGCSKEEKVKIEVLERRTSGGVKAKKDVVVEKEDGNYSSNSSAVYMNIKSSPISSHKSPPTSEAGGLKAKAISFIYKKCSSQEPERVKREVMEQHQEVKPPLAVVKTEEQLVKQESKPLIKEEPKAESKPQKGPRRRPEPVSSPAPVPAPSATPSQGSLTQQGAHSARKDKRKERDHRVPSREKEREKEHPVSHSGFVREKNKALEDDSSFTSSKKRKTREASLEIVPPQKSKESSRERPSSRNNTPSASKPGGAFAGPNPPKKLKTSHEATGAESPFVSPLREKEGQKETSSRLSPAASSRIPQRSGPPSEEAPAESSNRTPSHQIRPKQLPLPPAPPTSSQHLSHRGGGHPVPSPYLTHESEDDATDAALRAAPHPEQREKSGKECQPPPGSGVAPSEYRTLPNSEHGRSGEERTASPLALSGSSCPQPIEQAYSPEPDPLPGTSVEYNRLSHPPERTPAGPVYLSYFERQIPPVKRDYKQYLERGRELKHQADKAANRTNRLQAIVLYLEAVQYFILTGESMGESTETENGGTYHMLFETFRLILYFSSPLFKSQTNQNPVERRVRDILAVLSLRCQSLLSLKLYVLKQSEIKELHRHIESYQKYVSRQPSTLQFMSTPSNTASAPAGNGTPSVVATSGTSCAGNTCWSSVVLSSGTSCWSGSQSSAANNSPSSLSPTPSPAGSVGSEGSQSSGYSTEGNRMGQLPPQPPVPIAPLEGTPPQGDSPMNPQQFDIQGTLYRYHSLTRNLSKSYDIWNEADDTVYRHDLKDFFIELDHRLGPLTLHSSLRDLVVYVQKALDNLKKRMRLIQ